MGTSCTESVWDRSSQTLWIHPSFAFSFDHLVGAGQQRRRHVEAERLGGLQIEYDLILAWHLPRQGGSFLAFEYAIDGASRLPVLLDEIRPIGNQATGAHEVAVVVDRRQIVMGGARDDQIAVTHRPPAR